MVLALIVNMAVDEAEQPRADQAPLSETLERLSERHGEIVWPTGVAAAMADLQAAADRLAGLIARVSGDASDLGALAAEMSPPDGDEPPPSLA